MNVNQLFTQADLEAVQAAVREAEALTSGEIVPYVVDESDPYTGAPWKGAALGALLAPLLAVGVYLLGDLWGGQLALWIALPALAGGAAGYVLTSSVRSVRRSLAGDEVLDLRARRRAAVAFLDQEVFNTRERTGILLFLSLFEHRVVVLGDSGINRKVDQAEWDGIVAHLAAGIRSGRPAAALVEAIRECGALLERHGVARQADDRDELSNELRRGDS